MKPQDVTKEPIGWLNRAGLSVEAEKLLRNLLDAHDGGRDGDATRAAAEIDLALGGPPPRRATATEQPQQRQETPHPDEEAITRELLRRSIDKEVRSLRVSLFGSPKAPFPRQASKISEWLRREAAPPKRSREELVKIEAAHEDLSEAARRLSQLGGPTLRLVGVEHRSLGYFPRVTPTTTGAGLGVQQPTAGGSSKYEVLLDFVDDTCDAIGCSGFELVGYVFCGGQFPFRRLQMIPSQALNRAGLQLAECYITLRGFNLTEEDFRAAYRSFRDSIAGTPGKSPLDQKDYAIITEVLKAKPGPRELSAAFERIATRLKRLKMRTGAVKARYYRLPDSVRAMIEREIHSEQGE